MDITIDNKIDKEPFHCILTDEKIINITGEGGSGKTTYSNMYRTNPDYIVVDYDLIIQEDCPKETLEYTLKQFLLKKYGANFFKSTSLEETKNIFTTMYEEIINYLLLSNKTIVLDGTQLRFINDVDKIRGELLVLRTSIETCVERSVNRKQEQNPELSAEELKKYEIKRRHILYQLSPLLNNLLLNIEKKINNSTNNKKTHI